MPDFKKTPTPPANTDDYSPAPAFGTADIHRDVPAIKDDQQADDADLKKQAAPYWHPAWAVVQEKFEDLLEAYDGNNVLQFKDLPADEFKIKLLANQAVHAEISKIMEDVKSAVEEIESQPKRRQQPAAGA